MIRAVVLGAVYVLNEVARVYREFDRAYNEAMDRHYDSYVERLQDQGPEGA